MRKTFWALTWWAMVVLTTTVPSHSFGANNKKTTGEGVVNKLFGPGPLIHGHRDLEHGDCLKCHDAGQGVPDNRCLSCHTTIANSLKDKSSFHAKVTKSCISCHTDHKGRAFNSVGVNRKNFDHDMTGFALKGAHRKAKCVECHKSVWGNKNPFMSTETRFFGLDDSCKSCHRKDDIHKFTPKFAAKECSACHGTNTWKTDIVFDHFKQTGFALVGKHADLKCANCHLPKGKSAPPKYDFPGLEKQKCLTCHADFHKEGLSNKFRDGTCDRCHVQTTWKVQNFKHDMTGFILHGKHTEVSCVNCHSKSKSFQSIGKHKNWVGLDTTCASCHKDYHGFGNELSNKGVPFKKCENCHTDTGWMMNLLFDHNRDTDYPLTGKHIGVKCFACHKPKAPSSQNKSPLRFYDFPQLASKNCETCHKSPHLNDPAPIFRKEKCSTCHTTAGWKGFENMGHFDHSKLTRFPLTGDHTKLSCKECHVKNGKSVYKFPGSDKQFCEACHTTVHKEQFSPKFLEKPCVECHNTSTFAKLLPFNHNATDFKLTGAHVPLENQCVKCHIKTDHMLATKPPKPAAKFQFAGQATGFCESCHPNVHKDQFHKKFAETPCKECHNTDSFAKGIKFDHSTARWPLRGKHQTVKCLECHFKTKEHFPVAPFHAKDKFIFPDLQSKNCELCHEDEHDGRFGKDCTRCHNENSWAARADYHKNFLLNGVHNMIDCNDCHREGRRLTGTGQDCMTCHAKDDIHHGSQPDCKQCHTQLFWTATKFQHGLTAFPLRGAHRVLDCDACHAKGVYQGLSAECVSCHYKDNRQVTFPVHSGAGFETCDQCHNQFSFSGAKQ